MSAANMNEHEETSKKTEKHSDTPEQIETRQFLDEQPLVRVGLIENYERVDFRMKGKYAFATLEGEEIFSEISSDRRWRSKVENGNPAKYMYSVMAGIYKSEDEAKSVADSLEEAGHTTKILPYGRELLLEDNVVHEGKRWRVIVGAFETEQQARPNVQLLISNDSTDSHPKVLRHRIEEPTGTIELYDSEYEKNAMVEQGFRIIPLEEDAEITVYGIRVGAGFHWEKTEARAYRGVLEIRVDNNANLMALNELYLDEYLKGVIPSEMHHTYPTEALKAQAVAARSYTISKLSNRPISDPIDFPATVFFQVYSGVTYQNEATTNAVIATSGEVLKVGSSVCEAYFSSNSGGHTESKENWTPPAEPYLVGKPLFSKKNLKTFKLDLTKDADVEKWVTSYPENYSNPRSANIDLLNKNARYFRWEVNYSRRELEEIIQNKVGITVGTIIDILPLKRGVSGRITELEILGTHRNYRLVGELNIRRALSETTLYSSCFIVKPILDDMGNPVELNLIGAGFGHGVGMDQTAAGMMALDGMTYKDIVTFFYTGSKVEKIY
ncbi:SpoIID/LytB domain-containing protein [bacterium]|nr:SpoIID/LytB domain-containing protein [bacterium]